jgi:large subunit ribosomal protein L32
MLMAVPKNKKSKSKRDKRRTHDKLKVASIVECPRCHSKKIAHRVCENCGYYNNKEIIKIVSKEKSKEKNKETKTTKTSGGRRSRGKSEEKAAKKEKTVNE